MVTKDSRQYYNRLVLDKDCLAWQWHKDLGGAQAVYEKLRGDLLLDEEVAEHVMETRGEVSLMILTSIGEAHLNGLRQLRADIKERRQDHGLRRKREEIIMKFTVGDVNRREEWFNSIETKLEFYRKQAVEQIRPVTTSNYLHQQCMKFIAQTIQSIEKVLEFQLGLPHLEDLHD